MLLRISCGAAALAITVLTTVSPALADDDLRQALAPPDVGVRGLDPGEAMFPPGFAISLGGGVVGMLNGETNDFIEVGGGWDVRLHFATRFFISGELAYIGELHPTEAIGLDPDALLLGNGIEANVRVNVLSGMVQPFFFVGIGYRHYDLVNADFNTSAIVSDNDDVGHVPFGAGVKVRVTYFYADARFTFRPTWSSDLLGDGGPDLSTAAFDLLIGFEL